MDNVYMRMMVKGEARAVMGGRNRRMETRRYYSRLMLVGRRNTPSMGEAQRDLLRAYDHINVPFA
jgi:hypothetical protein